MVAVYCHFIESKWIKSGTNILKESLWDLTTMVWKIIITTQLICTRSLEDLSTERIFLRSYVNFSKHVNVWDAFLSGFFDRENGDSEKRVGSLYLSRLQTLPLPVEKLSNEFSLFDETSTYRVYGWESNTILLYQISSEEFLPSFVCWTITWNKVIFVCTAISYNPLWIVIVTHYLITTTHNPP